MHETTEQFKTRGRVLLLLAFGCALALIALLILRAVTEAGGTNSYALVAEALLKGQPFVDRCLDDDCAFRDGHTFIVFPPFPGVVAMPLVAAFGANTKGFIAIGALALGMTFLLWNRILRDQQVGRESRLWILIALVCASPLFYVAFRSEKIWFFAQILAFLLVTTAVHELLARRLVTAGIALGLAILCRQMSIFYAPLLLLLTFAADEPLLAVSRERIVNGLKLALPIGAALCVYLAYNYWRFGNPLETGYNSIVFNGGMLKPRVDEYGLWNKAYLLFNTFYFFLQGFHAEFADPLKIRLSGLDNSGTSVLAASPWLLFLVFTPIKRTTLFCAMLIIGMSAALLFYHSNGFSQYNTQRYILDWLPAALLMLTLVFRDGAIQGRSLLVFKLLVTWGIVLNVATVGVLAITHAG